MNRSLIIVGILALVLVGTLGYFVGYNSNESYGSFAYKRTLGDCDPSMGEVEGTASCPYETRDCRSAVLGGSPTKCQGTNCEFRYVEYENYVTGESFVCRIAVPK